MTANRHNLVAAPVAYNQPDAAAALGVSPRTLRRWEAAGIVRPRVINGVKVYPRVELERIVTEPEAKHQEGG